MVIGIRSWIAHMGKPGFPTCGELAEPRPSLWGGSGRAQPSRETTRPRESLGGRSPPGNNPPAGRVWEGSALPGNNPPAGRVWEGSALPGNNLPAGRSWEGAALPGNNPPAGGSGRAQPSRETTRPRGGVGRAQPSQQTTHPRGGVGRAQPSREQPARGRLWEGCALPRTHIFILVLCGAAAWTAGMKIGKRRNER